MSNGSPPHFIVVIPGYMGSKLRDKATGQIVWVDFSTIPLNPFQWDDWLTGLFQTLSYPNDNLEPAGIVDQVVFVPPWAKQEQYNRLIAALGRMGYRADDTKYAEKDLDVYCFAYDWRQDNRITARQLGEAIERWRDYHPGAQAWLIGHSNGGIVARWYIEKEGGKDRVGRLFLMGSPWDGAPKAMNVMFSGLATMFRARFNPFGVAERSRAIIRSFPSFYQIIPSRNPFLRDPNNEVVDFYGDLRWLENDQERALLLDGRRFNEELGTQTSVETLCFFGRKLPTTTQGAVRIGPGGRWQGIDWQATEAGDGTVPERSAIHPHAQAKLPFVVGHGDIYVNPAVLEFLQWELIDKYREGTRVALTTERLTILFEPDKDTYVPGEPIHVWATVHENESGAPFTGASIRAQLVWRAALPGSSASAPTQPLHSDASLSLVESAGRYEASLAAPQTEGYYQLRATVKAVGEPTVVLEELIAVDELTEGV
jgi:pimeloyl-ACP methyl ester carboxylesterase